MSQRTEKPVLLSGIQPSGHLTIGNYVGAVKNWVRLQDDYDCLFALVDLHTITEPQNPADLLRRSYDFLALYMACGIAAHKNTIFVQSHVPEHAQLAWILNCHLPMGELSRMTQFKEKSKAQGKTVNVGLFDYPALMATDILLYGTTLVPIGEDQKQHLELTRDLARRFNGVHGEIFVLPEPHVPRVGARIMGLQYPTAKMSKSDVNTYNYIALLDSPDAVRKKIDKAVTDCGREVVCHPSKPGISNLVILFSAVTDQSIESVQEQYRGKAYAPFKRDLTEALVALLGPLQARYKEVRSDTAALNRALCNGAQSARRRAHAMLDRVHRAIGFIPLQAP